MQNKEIRLASRPAGMPTLDNFNTIDTVVPQPKDGGSFGPHALHFSRSIPAWSHARRTLTVCQIAKIKGCRVIGIAGSNEKNRFLKEELAVDGAINYKHGDIRRAMKEACPNGIDVYFDNVGGSVSDAILPLLNQAARVAICGQISIYNLDQPDIGLRPQPYLLVSSAMMKGFIITGYAARFSEGIRQLDQWLSEGKLKYAETIVEGFENTPRAFIGLFSGENLGKQIVKIV